MFLDFHSEFYSWIRGGLFILFLYHFLIYFQNRSKLYLYYSFYMLALTIYLLKHVTPQPYIEVYKYLNFTIQFAGYAFYIAFARHLLDTRARLIKWDKYFEVGIKAIVAFIPGFIIIQFFFGYEFQEKAFVIIAPALTLFILLSYVVIVKRIHDKFSAFFVIGSLLYVVSANLSFAEYAIGKEWYYNLGLQPMFFMYLGSILQCLIFAIIIGFILRRIQDKSKNAEVRLAIKLKEMEEIKMTALQSQMNPHFLFNSLNSINNFVLKNQVEKASDYITKFSKLIRVILNSSSSPKSTLAEELKILALYIRLEQMRVSGGFTYEVNVSDDLNLDKIEVPPLFLQPFIENAIWHGITKKEGDKKIELNIKCTEDKVICVVKDNGIGIDKTKKLTHIDQRRKFSGAKATENRIRMLYQNKDVNIETNALTGNNTGTEVIIEFPLSSC